MTGFTDRAWQRTADIRRRIFDLPFLAALADGKLSPDRFRFYMLQDALYLEQFSRALSAAAVRAPDADAMQFYAHGAEVALIVERALHGRFFERFGIPAEQAAAAEPSPTCLAYTSFLLATAQTGSYGALTAAVLPCFWIYWEVGNRIAETAAAENPYRAWIDTYADPEFGEAVARARAIADRAAADAAPQTQADMLEAFARAMRYEWMFWDSAWRMEGWPV